MQIIKRGKFLKLAMLLLSSLLITTASAAVYNLMYIDTNVTAYSAKVYFTTDGADDATEAGTTVGTNGTYVSFDSLSGWPNATRVYEEAVVITNTDTSSKQCTLSVNSVNNVGSLSALTFTVNGTTLTALTAGTSITFTVSSGRSVPVEVRVQWSPTVTDGTTASVTLELKVPNEGNSE